MDSSLYQDLILDHYRNPRNYGTLLRATHRCDVKNPTCGDSLHMDITVKRGMIADIRFTGAGCAISQASASLLTEYVQGKSTTQTLALTPAAVLDLLGITLSPGRMKCGLLSLEAIKRSLENIRTASETTVDPKPRT